MFGQRGQEMVEMVEINELLPDVDMTSSPPGQVGDDLRRLSSPGTYDSIGSKEHPTTDALSYSEGKYVLGPWIAAESDGT